MQCLLNYVTDATTLCQTLPVHIAESYAKLVCSSRHSDLRKSVSLKAACKMLMTFRQFHQHYMCTFFIQTLFRQLFSSYMYIEKAAETTFV